MANFNLIKYEFLVLVRVFYNDVIIIIVISIITANIRI